MGKRKQSDTKVRKVRNVTTSSKGENKKKDKLGYWLTFILALIGAFAWTPDIIKLCKPNKIVGKIVSRYRSLNADKTQTDFLFKLSILSKNKPFNLMQISCEIEDINGDRFYAPALNNVRTLSDYKEGYKYELLIPGDEFLNNSSFFAADKNLVGYLSFKFDGNLYSGIRSTTFIFKSFEGKIKKSKFEEVNIQEEQLFYDKAILVKDSFLDRIEGHPAILPSTDDMGHIN